MSTKHISSTTRSRNVGWLALATLLLLMVPLIAMQCTDDVHWTISDFVVANALIFGAGLIYECIVRRINNRQYRIAAVAVLVMVFMLAWIELAVGLIGSPFAGS